MRSACRKAALEILGARHLGLYACREGLHSQDTGFQLVFAEDDDGASRLVGGFEGFFQPEAAFSELDARTADALAGELPSGQAILTTAGGLPSVIPPSVVQQLDRGAFVT